MSCRNPLGQELLVDLLGAPRWQAPAQKGTDLGLADIELLGQDPGVVSVPRKPGLQVVQTGDQYAVDKSRRDGLLCDLVGLLGYREDSSVNVR